MPKTKKFIRLLRAIKKGYVGKKVPAKWQKKYGKLYDEEEAKSIAYAVAKSMGWRT